LIDHLLDGKGIFRKGRVGNALTTTMMSVDLCDALSELLDRQPDLLLRHDTSSVITRRRLAYLYKVRPGLGQGTNLVGQGTT
ncbi:MAG: hypothetical protein JJU11_03340, partial [Candidatus Sumerlaeia bacterium]|nr:hypothetical protein [Candidatus Sumerlaeia bacterium]